MVIGLIGAFLFVIIQMILLIDFAHGWSESWVEKYEETEAKCYYYGKFCKIFVYHTIPKYLDTRKIDVINIPEFEQCGSTIE